MLFSYKTLCKYANLKNVSIEEVVNAINSIGFEVEEYHRFLDVEGIKFCHVLKCYKNPNADRLTVCELEYANGHKATIQTTATNMKNDDYVMSFVPGSRLGKQIFTAKTMQGVISEGMFIGLSDFGFDPNILPEELKEGIFKVGKIDLNLDPIQYFDFDDYIIDVTILSNRSDAACYLIFAKELAAYFKTDVAKLSKPVASLKSSIMVTSHENSKVYTLFEGKVNNLKIPTQKQMLLWKHGFKTYNNAKDLANLTLIFTGVPCQVYSKNSLKGLDFSIVKKSGEYELSAGQNVLLDDNLVIKAGSSVVSLAAIDTIKNFETKENDNSVIFELASFDLKEIRKSIKQIKFENQNSNRASREISNGSIILAYKFICQHLSEYSKLINEPKIAKKSILVDTRTITKFAGFSIIKTKKYLEALEKLTILDFKFKSDYSAVSFPSYRYDLNNIQDFIEEIFRFYGYDNFPSKSPKLTRLLINDNVESKYNSLLFAKDYLNTRTYTLINPKANIFNPFKFTKKYVAEASKNYEHSQIRYSFISSLKDVMVHNIKQGINKGSYFEIGMICDKMNVLGICSNKKTFNEIKLDILSLTNLDLEFRNSNQEIFNHNVATEIYLNEKLVGYIAKLHPSLDETNSIFCEIFLDEIQSRPILFKDYKHAPLKNRDITINLKEKESADSFIKKLSLYKGIINIKIIDIYKKSDGSKNITISLLLEEWATKKIDADFNK
ncbi:phenylalanine--tRNA ligase subunit beta [Metamycoplasma equirhinis]|uniref:phenylalanine--tRNA ligase subunit beta n=1 Tax=Metamycoplasma equirhinis TaxID=92402 RepID=UPI003593F816